MKISPWILPVGTLILGLAVGSLWSPRKQPLTPEQIAAAQARYATKSSNHNSGGSSSSSKTSARSHGGSERTTSLNKELTLENLMLSFSNLEDEEDLNPMELARYAAQISNLNEFDAKALLVELQGPFEDDQHQMKEFAEIVSVIVFSRLCELNGPEAMRMLHAGDLGKEMPDEFAAIGMNAWVAADPESASRWFNGALIKLDKIAAAGGDTENIEDVAGDLIVNGEVFESYMRSMANIDPEGLRDSISNFQSEEVRSEMQSEVAVQLVRNARTKEEIMNLLHDGTLEHYEHGKVELIEKLSQTAPMEAAKYAESQSPGKGRDAMFATVANELLQKNPAEGAAWYQEQELSPETTEGTRLQLITNRWMHRDLEGAATWLLDQPNNTERDYSESLLATRSAQTGEWEAAFRWNADITDSETQRQSLDRLMKQGWDRRNNTFNQDADQAARTAGLGQAVDNYIQARTPAQGGAPVNNGYIERSVPRE